VALSCLQSCLRGSAPKRKVFILESQSKIFFDYTRVYWPLHCAKAGKFRQQGRIWKAVDEFLYDEKKASANFRDWIRSYMDSWIEMDLSLDAAEEDEQLSKQLSDSENKYSRSNPVFLACAFGFIEIIKDGRRFEDKDRNVINSNRCEPFTVAVRHGQRDIVECLGASNSSASNSSTSEQANCLDSCNIDEPAEYGSTSIGTKCQPHNHRRYGRDRLGKLR